MPELVLKIAMSPAKRLTEDLPSAPLGLEHVILRCLEKDRSKRYPTIGALAAALLEFAPRRSKASVERISGIMQRAGMSATAFEQPPSSSAAELPARESAATQASWGQTSRTVANRKRVLWAVVGSSAAVAALVTAGYLLNRARSLLPSPALVGSTASVLAAEVRLPSSIPEPRTTSASAPIATLAAAKPAEANSAEAAAPSASAPERMPNKPTHADSPPPKPAALTPKPVAPALVETPQVAPKPTPASPLKMKLE